MKVLKVVYNIREPVLTYSLEPPPDESVTIPLDNPTLKSSYTTKFCNKVE
jgi:hypothetical protein